MYYALCIVGLFIWRLNSTVPFALIRFAFYWLILIQIVKFTETVDK